ncbi:MAG: CorA family divalent cation transporter [Lentisphaeria bacterium]|nr:CorA family divalent cation transporter [Lentisphaeria bacterium]
MKRLNLPISWKLPVGIKQHLGGGAGKQRVIHSDGQILMILHKLPEIGKNSRVGVLFFKDEKGQWNSDQKQSPEHAMKRLIKEYNSAILNLEEGADHAHTAQDYFDIQHQLVPICRAVRNLKATMLKAHDLAPECEFITQYLDDAEDLDRISDILRIDVRNAADYSMAKQAEEQSRKSDEISLSAHKLNMLVATFLPVTAIAAIFGMNLKTGLEHFNSPFLFWGLMLCSMAIGFIVKGFLTPKNR